MASEKYANNAATTLNGAINNSTTTVVVTSAAAFPSVGQFRIKVGDEIMLVTGVSSNTFTVATRGTIDGTSAASHSNLDVVTHVLTKGALDQIIIDNCQDVAYSSLPSAEKAGRNVFINNGVHLFRDNGSTLDAYGNVNKMKIPPTVSSFTWDNQNSATATDNVGTIFLSKQSSGTIANQLIVLYKTAPSPPYKLTAKIIADVAPQNFAGYGLVFRQSSDGKLAGLTYVFVGSLMVAFARKFTNSTTFSADYFGSLPQYHQPWVRIEDDNTNRICSVSCDGVNWKVLHTVGRTDFLTADQIGFCINPEKQSGGTTVTNTISLVSWLEH